MWAYGIPCPAMGSPNASQHKEDKQLYSSHYLVWYAEVDSGPHTELLIQASAEGSFLTVQYLLSLENIDVNHKEQINEKCALQTAIAGDHNAIVKLLLRDTRVDYAEVKLTPLKVAVIVNNVQEIMQEIQSVSVGREELTELLVLASWYGSLDIVQYLLEQTTVDVNSKEKETGECALYAAAKYRHKDIVELLLERPEVDIYSGES